ncbi:hypothetical protein A2229_03955 [Candidatus Peregrinibacteria bacterium RIFOXYA2_FULL_33_7]|nr:MAG: hypothetical protein A2229_03955 [Candidatus Peregrinibacteria bacterium RIFOXYA2_FULL_33_7]
MSKEDANFRKFLESYFNMIDIKENITYLEGKEHVLLKELEELLIEKLKLISPGNDGLEPEKTLLMSAINHEDLRNIWPVILSKEIKNNIRTTLGGAVEFSPDDALRRFTPDILFEFSNMKFVDDLTEPKLELGEKRSQNNEKNGNYPHMHLRLTAANSRVVEVDCTREDFGFKAGDIITCGPDDKWAEQNIFVEGYSLNFDGEKIVMWGRRIASSGGLTFGIRYNVEKNKKNLTLVKRWGEYDSFKDYGFDVFRRDNRQLSSQSEVVRNRAEYIEKIKGIDPEKRIDIKKEPYKLNEVFEEFKAAILRIEFDDFLKRLNKIFPLKDFSSIKANLELCKLPAALEGIAGDFFKDFDNQIGGVYTQSEIDRLAATLKDHRERILDIEPILFNAFDWMREGLFYKLGYSFDLEANDMDDFPRSVNELVQRVAYMIAPLFLNVEERENEVLAVYIERPQYYQMILEKYSNPLDAAKHIVAISLNGVAELYSRAAFYNFKHVTAQVERVYKDSNFVDRIKDEIVSGVSKKENLTQIALFLDQTFESLKSDLRDFCDNIAGFNVSKECTAGDLIEKIETSIGSLDRITDKFLDVIALRSEYMSNEFTGDSKSEDELIKYIKENLHYLRDGCEKLKKTLGVRDNFLSYYTEAIKAFLESPALSTYVVDEFNSFYPLKTVNIAGAKIDCLRNDFGFSGGDIVEIYGNKYFFEGYQLKENNDVNHLYFRKFEGNKIDFSSDRAIKYFPSDSENEFNVLNRWGTYDPSIYGYNPLKRFDQFEYSNTENYVSALIDSMRFGFWTKKIFVDDCVNYVAKGLGNSVFTRIMIEVRNPKRKDLPLQTRLLYFDRDFYSVYPSAPPSSSGKNVLRFEISTGCNYRRCTYCNLYSHEKFTLMQPQEFEKHFQMIREYLGAGYMVENFSRVFLTGGNGFAMPTDNLVSILEYIIDNNKGRIFNRIESYATTASIIKKGPDELKKLISVGLKLVYWGMESGADEVLNFVEKGYTQADVLEAGKLLNEAGIQASVTVMPGLGGIKHAEKHAKETAKVAAQIFPQYLTFMSVYAPNTPYEQEIQASSNNRPLRKEELIEQIKVMKMLYVDFAKQNPLSRKRYAKCSAHGPSVTPTSYNPEEATFSITI